jgi:hypothetical protein
VREVAIGDSAVAFDAAELGWKDGLNGSFVIFG